MRKMRPRRLHGSLGTELVACMYTYPHPRPKCLPWLHSHCVSPPVAHPIYRACHLCLHKLDRRSLQSMSLRLHDLHVASLTPPQAFPFHRPTHTARHRQRSLRRPVRNLCVWRSSRWKHMMAITTTGRGSRGEAEGRMAKNAWGSNGSPV